MLAYGCWKSLAGGGQKLIKTLMRFTGCLFLTSNGYAFDRCPYLVTSSGLFLVSVSVVVFSSEVFELIKFT